MIIEFIGLPGSGKSTVCDKLESILKENGYTVANLQKMLPRNTISQKVKRRIFLFTAVYSRKNKDLRQVLNSLKFDDSPVNNEWKNRILIMNYRIMTQYKKWDYILLDEGLLTFVTSLFHEKNIADIDSVEKIFRAFCMEYRSHTIQVHLDVDEEKVIHRIRKRNKSGDRFLRETDEKMLSALKVKEANLAFMSDLSEFSCISCSNDKSANITADIITKDILNTTCNPMIISTSGYYSTGASSVFVLLKEYSPCSDGILKNWELKSHDYESTLLYLPNGLFDLEDKLLFGNSIHRSDEALRNFRSEMKRLYDNKYVWCGDYKRLIGDDFMTIVDQFIEELEDFQVPSHWGYHLGDARISPRKLLGSIRRVITGKKIQGDFCKVPQYRWDPEIHYAFPSEDKFYAAARKFIDSYCNLMRGELGKNKILLLNHFILPHNLHRLSNYFGPDEVRAIVVDRDPRDVFVMEKYRTRSDHTRIPVDDVKDFVRFWKKLRNCEKQATHPGIIRIQFEDLIYHYDGTVAYIEKRCGLAKDQHIFPGKYYSPEKSKYNTQLFRLDDKWNEEISYIEKELPEYLYDFPEDTVFEFKVSADSYGIYVN